MITTGLVKGQKVICTTDKYEGPCKTLLLTLEPNENKWKIVVNGQDAYPTFYI